MAERTCAGCGASAEPKLKFCRECGGLVEGPPAPPASEAPTGGVSAEAGAGDATVIASGRIREPEPPTEAGRLAGAGDETIISGLAAAAAKGRAPAGSGDETILSGTVRSRATQGPPPPTPEEDIAADLQRTFLGSAPPEAMAPLPPAPPPPAPPPAPAAPPPARTPAPPPPPPRPPPRPLGPWGGGGRAA